jgi:deoxyribose-phosphate aldolase
LQLTASEIARMIDVSAVQAYCGEQQVGELAEQALRHRFFAAHVLPCWVPLLRDLLGAARQTLVGAPVGFPGGGHATSLKIAEAKQLVAAGIDEMDLMMNVGMLRSGRRAYVLDEVRAVIDATAPKPVKVIIEVHWLSPDQIREACDICIEGGAGFVKTSTGWAPEGATMGNVELITKHVAGRIGVKVSGGVRTLETFRKMLGLGVRRFGINLVAANAIIEECQRQPGGFISV